MTPEESIQAVRRRSRVTLFTANGRKLEPYAEGRIVSYSLVPTVEIETDDGERISWRHDLAEVVENSPETAPGATNAPSRVSADVREVESA